MRIEVRNQVKNKDEKKENLMGMEQGYTSIDRKYTCLIDGSIDNLDQLAKKLKKAGIYLKGDRPEEVVIELYRFSGTGIWEELQGHYAMVIYNHKTEELTALRDPYGAKQLYYRLGHQGIEFGTELRTFQPTALNKEAMHQYFSFHYVPEDGTPFQDVYHVPSGCILTYKNGRDVEILPYADLTLIHGSSHSLVTPCRMRKVMTETIYDQLQQAQKVGIRLTGHVSDVALASITKYATSELKAFFFHCEGTDSEEEKYIQKVAEELEMKLTYLNVTPQAYIQATKEALTHLYTPIADREMPLQFLFFQTVSNKVDAVLSLDGGKELFGYDHAYKVQHRLESIANRTNATRRRLLQLAKHSPNRLKRLLLQGCLPLSSHYPGNTEFDLSTLLNWKGSSWKNVTNPLYKEISDLDWLEQMQTIDLNLRLKASTLLQTNVLSKANNVEVKRPFLDEKIVEIANDLTKAEKLGERKKKPLLMEAFKHDVPEYVRSSKKKTSSVPLAKWLREDLYEDVHRLFNDPIAKEWINLDMANQMLLTHRLKKGEFSQEIWTVAVFIMWLKERSRT